MSATLELDCRGMVCPLPVITLARRIGEVAIGETVAIRADDPAAATDIPAWCRLRSQRYVGVEGDRYVVERTS